MAKFVTKPVIARCDSNETNIWWQYIAFLQIKNLIGIICICLITIFNSD